MALDFFVSNDPVFIWGFFLGDLFPWNIFLGIFFLRTFFHRTFFRGLFIRGFFSGGPFFGDFFSGNVFPAYPLAHWLLTPSAQLRFPFPPKFFSRIFSTIPRKSNKWEYWFFLIEWNWILFCKQNKEIQHLIHISDTFQQLLVLVCCNFEKIGVHI